MFGMLKCSLTAAVLAGAVVVLAVPPAHADDDEPLLAGPKVEAEAKEEGTMTRRGEQQRSGARLQEPPPRLWLRFANALELTDEQREKADELIAAHRKQMREFEDEHGEAMRSLQEKLRELRRDGAGMPAMREIREEFEELRSKGPDPAELQSAIWELLNEAQQEALRERISQWQEMRAERMRERRGERPGPGAMLRRGEGARDMNVEPDDEVRMERRRPGQRGAGPERRPPRERMRDRARGDD